MAGSPRRAGKLLLGSTRSADRFSRWRRVPAPTLQAEARIVVPVDGVEARAVVEVEALGEERAALLRAERREIGAVYHARVEPCPAALAGAVEGQEAKALNVDLEQAGRPPPPRRRTARGAAAPGSSRPARCSRGGAARRDARASRSCAACGSSGRARACPPRSSASRTVTRAPSAPARSTSSPRPLEVGVLALVAVGAGARLLVAGHSGRQQRAARLEAPGQQARQVGNVDGVGHPAADAHVVERLAGGVEHEGERGGAGLLPVAVLVLRPELGEHRVRRRIAHVVQPARDHRASRARRVGLDVHHHRVDVAGGHAVDREVRVAFQDEAAVAAGALDRIGPDAGRTPAARPGARGPRTSWRARRGRRCPVAAGGS